MHKYIIFFASKNNYYIITENSAGQQLTMRIATAKQLATLGCAGEVD
jgi:hypothetical protein